MMGFYNVSEKMVYIYRRTHLFVVKLAADHLVASLYNSIRS